METLSFINHKGGVGKTTLCTNVAQALALTGHTVLCIDNDSQHNLTSRLGLSVSSPSVREIYRGSIENIEQFLSEGVRETSVEGLHLISSEFNLSNADVTDTMALSNFLQHPTIQEYYDFVLIDNHPGLEPLQKASIAASTRLIIPVLLKQQSMEGLAEMLSFLSSTVTLTPEILTIVPNIAENIKIQHKMFSALLEIAGDFVADVAIPLDRSIEEVEQEGKILLLDRFASSKSVPFFATLIYQLFPQIATNSTILLNRIRDQVKFHRSEKARQNLLSILGGKNE